MSKDNTTEKGIPLQNSNDPNPDSIKIKTLPISGRNASSTSSVKIKKSSNIFSSLVRKARRKKTPSICGNEELKNLHISSQNLSGSSVMSLGVHIEEVEINNENYDKKDSQTQDIFWENKLACSETNTSNHSLASFMKNTKHVFDIKVIPSGSQDFKNIITQTSQSQNKGQYHCTEHENVALKCSEENYQEETAISSFVNFEKSTLNVSLADGIHYVQETVQSLHESENRIIDLLNKYIKDPSALRQLMAAVSFHSKLQWDAERRSCSLANDMWMQQLEIGRAQEKFLQNTLNSLVKQNRQLQIANENLYRKNEKSMKMLRGSEIRPREHDSHMDSVLRHNEKLLVKLETVFKKCESLEGELLIFQKQNDSMERQLRDCTTKMQNMKATIYKMKTEYELDQTELNYKLEAKDQILKEALEAGDVVLEDLDGLKRQLKNMPFTLSWSKFKVRGSCLTDLIHICRSCINELSKEVVNMHTEITIKDKDILTLSETNARLQESLQKSRTELDIMSKKIEDNCAELATLHLNEQKCRMLENEVASLEEQTGKLRAENAAEQCARVESMITCENYKREFQEKDKLLEQTKLFMANITSENYCLKNDIAILSQMLKETGEGDLGRETDSHKYKEAQQELKKLQKENQNLMAELGTAQNENNILIANQETTYENLQRQIKELEQMNEETQTLRKKFDAEHQTVTSLQNERMKYLEEKNILKSIIHHLKNELSKIKQLEENLTNVTKEASKLGFAAEYNKQQGEKLKKEVIERDAAIAQLKSSVHQLNELQMQHATEKLALCYELNEVSNIKEKLSEVLDTEVKKNEELGQSKEAIVKSVNTQIQKIEEKQRNERTALRVLLKDIKIIADEKEQLSKEKDKLKFEIEQLNVKLVEQGKKYDELTKEITKKEQENAELKKEREHLEKRHKEMKENLEKAESKYDLNIKQLKKLIEQLRIDKKDLQTSNEYLKNTLEKVHKDLNISRQKEMTAGDILNKTKQQHEETQTAVKEQTESIRNLNNEKEKLLEEKNKVTEENEKLIKETNYLNTILEKVVNDFEKSIKSSEEKERLFKREFDESKKLLLSYAQEIQDLNKTIDLKEKRIEELNSLANDEQFHQKRFVKLKEEMERLETEYKKLKETKINLENQIVDLHEEYDKSSEHLRNVEKESLILENQLKIVLDQKEEDYVFYKKHIAELLRTRDDIESQYQKEIHSLKQQLQEANNKMINEKAAYETLSQIHKEVSAKFMKSIKDLVDAKNSKHEIAEQIKEKQEIINSLENEKEELNKQLNSLTDELEMSKHVVIQLNEENNLLQKSYSKALDKCVSLEYEVKRMELDHHQEIKEGLMNSEHNSGLQQEIENSKKELEETNATTHRLKMEISELQQEITRLQIERSEITLELHETKKKLETEKNLSEQLKNTHKLLLAAVLQLKEDGKVDPADCIHLLHMVRSSTNIPTDGVPAEKF